MTERAGAILMTDDPLRAVALASALVVVPLRAWVLWTRPEHVESLHYSTGPFQVFVLVAFLLLGAAAMRARLRWVGYAAVLCLMASVAQSSVALMSDWESGTWVFWACKALLMFWVVYRCAYRRGFSGNGAPGG